MIIVYTPADGEPEQYDARTLLSSEAAIVGRTIDQKWPAIKEGLTRDDLDAMRGVVWVLRKRHAPTLRFAEFDPGVEELTTRYDKTEIEEWVNNGFAYRATDPTVTIEQVVLALAEVPESAADPEHARAYIERCRVEAVEAEAGGKDQSQVEEAPAPMESAPEQTTSATRTSAPSEPSTSGSSLISSTSGPATSTS
ncbi:hypothetical protein [Streptomyces sp. OR43]|uniref:hypothetical protein n=1 Tax=Streptomyces sp. or43 TaxID=2478957 RepID=UPI0011CD5C47|nr:hypothetical protein [Streptomyces sp. or43]TXS36923.1 hypothetical protein EAO72_26410 [Streptomyces sp. or43]